MKNLKGLLLVITLFAFFNLSFTTVHAATVGSVIGEAKSSDIIASVNDYNIYSFNINGNTAVVVEDLQNYGFDVSWNAENKSLYVSKGNDNVPDSVYIAPEIKKENAGKKLFNVLYSDIKTYINDEYVQSFNINGKTAIYIDELNRFGVIKYDENVRRLDVDIPFMEHKIGDPCASSILCNNGMGFNINSVGGIRVYWEGKNNSHKTINYYTTTYYMFNAVNDLVYDEIKNKCSFSIKTVGPVAPEKSLIDFTSKYDSVVYCSVCQLLVLYNIYVEYSDGTSETIYYGKVGYETLSK